MKIWDWNNRSKELVKGVNVNNQWGWAIKWINKHDIELIIDSNRRDERGNIHMNNSNNIEGRGGVGSRMSNLWREIREFMEGDERWASGEDSDSEEEELDIQNMEPQVYIGTDIEEPTSLLDMEEVKLNIVTHEQSPLLSWGTPPHNTNYKITTSNNHKSSKLDKDCLLLHTSKSFLQIIHPHLHTPAKLQKLKSQNLFGQHIMPPNNQDTQLLSQIIHCSRYLFLDFIPHLSLVIVANQGGFDLQIFWLTRKSMYLYIYIYILTSRDEKSEGEYDLKLIYLWRARNYFHRILGISYLPIISEVEVKRELSIYILTSGGRLSTLHINRRGTKLNRFDIYTI